MPEHAGTRFLIVSADSFPADRLTAAAEGREPTIDVLELVRELGADLISYDSLRQGDMAYPCGYHPTRVPRPCLPEAPAGFRRGLRLIARLAREAAALRQRYDAVLLLGEDLAIPYAWYAGAPKSGDAAVVSIGHYLHPLKKSLPLRFRWLGGRVDRWILYSPVQSLFAQERLQIPADRLEVIPFHADARFYHPAPNPVPRDPSLLVAAGFERRDYATLFAAVEGTGCRMELGAASPWSRFKKRLPPLPPRTNNRFRSRSELRELYWQAGAVVVPLVETEFQAGISVVTEAMATGAPVIFTATSGLRHLVRDGHEALLVAPGDVFAMRRAIERLQSDPESAARMGAEGRRKVLSMMDTSHFVARISHIMRQAAARQVVRSFHILPSLFVMPETPAGGTA